jgi:pimeloyl-ACP methyl ester carboxylesterase
MTKRFLLIHGSWHGAWCWFKVRSLLAPEAEVVVPDLPGRGRAPARMQLVTLGRMVRALVPAIRAGGPTTIVVHSRYGVLATALAEAFPDAIRRVIYLASFMLPSGERVKEHFATDEDSYLRRFVRIDRFGACDSLAPEAYVEGLYADCSGEDIALASSLLCREPSLPALARVTTTAARFGRVPTAYIRLDHDRAVSPALQDRLIAAGRPDRVERIAASHSAYFSRPRELADAILRIDRA